MNDAARELDCAEARRLIGLRHDNELDALESIRVERHLSGCEACRSQAHSIALLGSALRERSLVFEPPAGFAPRVPGAVSGRRRFALPIAASFLAGSLLTFGAVRLLSRAGSPGEGIAREAVAAQIRSSLAGHLIDVVSSDQHTVKPWFSGKLDYSPPVVDLGPEGFPLEGGRLDYIGGRTVSALVYRRRQHVINLFVWPSAGSSDAGLSSLNGFHVAGWAGGGMAFWAVSDVNPAELRKFAALVRERTGPAR